MVRRLTALLVTLPFLLLSLQGGMALNMTLPPSATTAGVEMMGHHHDNAPAPMNQSEPGTPVPTPDSPAPACPSGHCAAMTGCLTAITAPAFSTRVIAPSHDEALLPGTTLTPPSWLTPPDLPPPRA